MKRREKSVWKNLFLFLEFLLVKTMLLMVSFHFLETVLLRKRVSTRWKKGRTRTYFSLGSANSSSSAFSSGVGAGCWGWWCFEVILIPPAFTKTKIKQNKIKVRRIIVVCISISLLREKHGWPTKLWIRENNSSLTTCGRVASFQIFIFLFRGWRHGEEYKFSAFKLEFREYPWKIISEKLPAELWKVTRGLSGVCD